MSSWSERVGDVARKLGMRRIEVQSCLTCKHSEAMEDCPMQCKLIVRILRDTPAVGGDVYPLMVCDRYRKAK